ncbi:MAG: hypothetical protein AAGE96_08850 [Cyanobacteria bacterium P01_G01_bin.19]
MSPQIETIDDVMAIAHLGEQTAIKSLLPALKKSNLQSVMSN